MEFKEHYRIHPVSNGIILSIDREPVHKLEDPNAYIDHIFDRFQPYLERLINAKSEEMNSTFDQIKLDEQERRNTDASIELDHRVQMIFANYDELHTYLSDKLS